MTKPRQGGHPIAKPIEIFLAFVLMGLIWVGEAALITQLQAMRCPPSTFLSGSPRLASIFVMVAPGLAAIGPGFILANFLTTLAPAVSRFFNGAPHARKPRHFWRDQAALAALGLATAAVALTISFVASLNQFCLTPDAIFTRAAPWDPMRSYPWSAVRTVTTSCTPASKGGWDADYSLGLPGGRSLDLAGGTAPPWNFQSQIFSALHSGTFQFDASKVDAHCGADNVDMLLRRP